MKIVADENIPFVHEMFMSLGEVACLPGREMTPEVLADAEVLLVRSITRVNVELLADSAVRFVGTATIGTDHIDLEYLENQRITFTSAIGSNSNSVAEYVITALLVLARKHGWNLPDMTLGIIGVGNIGSKLEKKAAALGLQVLLNDPPLQRQTGDPRFLPLDRILEEAHIISCHVPLTKQGPDATWHLFNEARINSLTPDTILLNTSRGAVVDNQALKRRLQRGNLGQVVLDVWENEPEIDMELLDYIAVATPHIAGYSFDGKVNGTVMLYQELCRFLGQPETVKIEDFMPDPPVPGIDLDSAAGTDQDLLAQALTGIYDLMADDGQIREMTRLAAEDQGKYFDSLRKNYPIRREAFNTRIRLSTPNDGLKEKLTILGFQS